MKAITFFFVVIIFISCECGLCDINKELYNIEVRGRIINTYSVFDNNAGRPVSHTLILNNNNDTLDVLYLNIESLKVKDSIYKPKNSLILELYRQDDFVEKIDLNCNCSYAK